MSNGEVRVLYHALNRELRIIRTLKATTIFKSEKRLKLL